MSVYATSPVKRCRRTRAELADLQDAIVAAVELEHPVSLRGVFYRVVSAGAIEKTEKGYFAVQRELMKLRADGRVPYSHISDGTRWITKPTTYTGIDQAVRDLSASYRRDLWHSSPVEVHVFAEKDAISGTITPVTDEWNVALGVLRGYASTTYCYSVADSIVDAWRWGGKAEVYVYQLGDHDPSGVDAWRAFTTSVRGFVEERQPYSEHWLHFERLAVTPEQIADLSLPTRPTKRSDTRSAKFRGESVEVDAIPPTVLRGILDNAISQHVDQHALRLHRLAEDNERDLLQRLAGNWTDQD